jgi:hypothetical protein
MARRVVRREGHRQQAALAARADRRAEVQERLGLLDPAEQLLDRAALLDDEDPVGIARRCRDRDRARERPDLLELRRPGAPGAPQRQTERQRGAGDTARAHRVLALTSFAVQR